MPVSRCYISCEVRVLGLRSVDENNFLNLFLQDILSHGPNHLTCSEFQDLFIRRPQTNSPGCQGRVRLQTIQNSLASSTNPDFVGMDKYLNSAKENLLNPQSLSDRAKRFGTYRVNPNKSIKDGLEVLEDQIGDLGTLALGIAMIRTPDISNAIVRTNTRLFETL